jgi:hypothetical protein
MKALERLMHPDYTIIKPDGSVWNREKALSSYIPGKRVWDAAQSSDHHVRIFDKTAIVIGLWKARGVNNGVPFDYQARYTSIWVEENGILMMVSDQSTELP